MYSLTVGLIYRGALKLEEEYRYDFLLFDCNSEYIESNKISNFVFVFRTVKKYAKDDILNNVFLDVIESINLNSVEIAMHGNCHYHFIKTEDDISDGIKLSENIEILKRSNEFEITYYASVKNQTIVKQGHYGSQDSQPFNDVNISYKLFTKNKDKVINCTEIEFPYIFKLQQDHIWHNNKSYNIISSDLLLNLGEGNTNDELKKSLDIVKNAIKKESNYWDNKGKVIFKELLEYRKNKFKYKIME